MSLRSISRWFTRDAQCVRLHACRAVNTPEAWRPGEMLCHLQPVEHRIVRAEHPILSGWNSPSQIEGMVNDMLAEGWIETTRDGHSLPSAPE